MAQDGDTITYTFAGSRVTEDISSIQEITIEYINGATSANSSFSNGEGGAVENVTVDVTGKDFLYLWVGGSNIYGRYNGGLSPFRFIDGEVILGGGGGGSTEVAFVGTDASDGPNEPVLAGAGGGGGGSETAGTSGTDSGGGGGGRGGLGASVDGEDGGDGRGEGEPFGGDAGQVLENAEGGSGYIDSREIISGGSTSKGGETETSSDGEIQISYTQTLTPPDPPSNLSAEVQ